MLFDMASKVREEWKNFKINRKGERLKKILRKSGRSSALLDDLAGLLMRQLVTTIDDKPALDLGADDPFLLLLLSL